MNNIEVRDYCLSLPHVTEDMPYGPDMVVYRIGNKIFLHQPLEYADPRISIKLPPEEAEILRDKYTAITPAYHLNKRHWSEILIGGYLSDDQIKEWILESYNLVYSALPKKVKESLQSS